MGTAPETQRKATYVAPRPDWDWLLNEQRKLASRDFAFHGNPGRVSMPSRALAPAGKARLRQRVCLARLDALTKCG